MSLFTRIINVFRGMASLFVSGIEKENPAIAYENAINAAVSKFDRAKNAVAAIIANRQKVEQRLKKAQAELAQVNADLDAALATDQDDLAELLVQKQEQLEKQVNEASTELQALSAQAEESKDMLMQFKGEIDRLKSERDSMLAKHATAQAQIQIQNQLSGLSVDAEIKALDNVREGINNTVAKAQLNSEIASTDVDQRLRKLRQTAGSTTAKAKVAALKAARQQNENKTM